MRKNLSFGPKDRPVTTLKKKGCADCDSYKYEVAYYMVQDTIWKDVQGGNDRLCLYCLTKRLGRKLTRSDFKNIPMNNPILSVLDCVEK